MYSNAIITSIMNYMMHMEGHEVQHLNAVCGSKICGVSFDGSWQKCGHNSNCVVTAVSTCIFVETL